MYKTLDFARWHYYSRLHNRRRRSCIENRIYRGLCGIPEHTRCNSLCPTQVHKCNNCTSAVHENHFSLCKSTSGEKLRCLELMGLSLGVHLFLEHHLLHYLSLGHLVTLAGNQRILRSIVGFSFRQWNSHLVLQDKALESIQYSQGYSVCSHKVRKFQE